MLTQVVLHGELGERFGSEWSLDIATPTEALRALRANCGPQAWDGYWEEHLKDGFNVVVRGPSGDDEYRDVRSMFHPISSKETLHFMPAVQGSGFVAAVLGSFLMALSTEFMTAWVVSETGLMVLAESAVGAIMADIGMALIVMGVSSVLTQSPKANDAPSRESPENKPSYVFDGPVNTVAQGNVVPVGYGELIVGSHVISAGMSIEEIPI